MTRKRTKALGLVALIAAAPLLLQSAAGAFDSEPATVDRSGDGYPAWQDCTDGTFWWQWVDGPVAVSLSEANPRLVLTDPDTRDPSGDPLTGDPITVPAGYVTIREAVTWDTRDAQSPPELFEQMRVEFYRDGVLIGATPLHTPDLADDVQEPWLAAGLGTVKLPADATEVQVVHASQFLSTEGENIFFPKVVCMTWTPFVPNPVASVVADCDSATLTMTNEGEGTVEVSYGINDNWDTVVLGEGESHSVDFPLTEDTDAVVEVWANDEQLLAETIHTDCVPPPTEPPTTTTPTTEPPATPPTTEVQTEVLAQTVTAPEPQLAFTGDDSVRNAAIGAALLAAGAAMIVVSRRRQAAER
ncbi:MAG TPA: hypothetical protein VF183_15940 [Acidimicrobiales bacterium]